MTPAEVEREVLAAFAVVPKPTQAALISHQCCECEELASDLWPFAADAVPHDVLARHAWDLPLLSDEGKRYYLPAWLLHGLHKGGENAVDAVVFALDSDHRWKPQPPYTSQEWLAVDRWLAYVATREQDFADDIQRVRDKLPK
jgi:hypothetical protein